MDRTSPPMTQQNLPGLTLSAEGRSAEKPAAQQRGTNRERTSPSGRICCGLSLRSYQLLLSLSNQPAWIALSSYRGPQTWNALATGSQGELLIANTGCPRDVPAGLSSADWESLGWPYGITYTLTASEWKGRTYKGARASDSMGTVPTVCEAEYLQGFRPGSLHSWAREMLSRNPSRNGSADASSRATGK